MKEMPKDLESKMTVMKALLKNMYSMMAAKKKGKPAEEPEEEMAEEKEEGDDMPSFAGLLANKKRKVPKFSLMAMSVSKKPSYGKKGKM